MDLRDLLRNIANEVLGGQQMSDEHFEDIYRQIEERIDQEPPPKFAILGQTGVGKSSTINALFKSGLDVSHTEACTKKITGVEVKVSDVEGVNGSLVVYDMPGLGESLDTEDRYVHLYSKILKDVDVAIWIVDAQNRAMSEIQRNLRDNLSIVNPRLIKNMVIALNKIDLVYPGDWHPLANMPSEEQENNIEGRIRDVRSKIRAVVPQWSGSIIGYSADKRYNLPQFFALMLDSVTTKRQWVVASRKAIADFLDLVDPRFLPPEIAASRSEQHRYVPQQSKVSELIALMPPNEWKKLAQDPVALQKWLQAKGH